MKEMKEDCRAADDEPLSKKKGSGLAQSKPILSTQRIP